jgi:hypothetical protein
VRSWLAQTEKEEHRLQSDLARAEGQTRRQPLQVHPERAKQYLDDLRETLEKGGLRARQLLKGDIERIILHSVLDVQKPFARAEVISTGKGLLERVAFVVAGAGFEPTTFYHFRC